MLNESIWEKENPNDNIWWKFTGNIGEHIFSFDKIHEFNLFQDYPYKLTAEQKNMFDKENPYWKNFFRGRK